MLIGYTALVLRVFSACTFGSNFINLQILHGTWPLSLQQRQYYGGPIRTHHAKTPLRVVELSAGTICASLPFSPAFYQHHRLKPSQVAALKTITNKLKPFRSSRKVGVDHLETGLIGSVQGEGKFLKSGDLTDITGSTDTIQFTEQHRIELVTGESRGW